MGTQDQIDSRQANGTQAADRHFSRSVYTIQISYEGGGSYLLARQPRSTTGKVHLMPMGSSHGSCGWSSGLYNTQAITFYRADQAIEMAEAVKAGLWPGDAICRKCLKHHPNWASQQITVIEVESQYGGQIGWTRETEAIVVWPEAKAEADAKQREFAKAVDDFLNPKPTLEDAARELGIDLTTTTKDGNAMGTQTEQQTKRGWIIDYQTGNSDRTVGVIVGICDGDGAAALDTWLRMNGMKPKDVRESTPDHFVAEVKGGRTGQFFARFSRPYTTVKIDSIVKQYSSRNTLVAHYLPVIWDDRLNNVTRIQQMPAGDFLPHAFVDVSPAPAPEPPKPGAYYTCQHGRVMARVARVVNGIVEYIVKTPEVPEWTKVGVDAGHTVEVFWSLGYRLADEPTDDAIPAAGIDLKDYDPNAFAQLLIDGDAMKYSWLGSQPQEVARVFQNGMRGLPHAADEKRWTVRVYRNTNSMVAEDDAMVVEVYDRDHPHTRFGQFTGARYYLTTLLGHQRGSDLQLDCGIPAWTIFSTTMDRVLDWLAGFPGQPTVKTITGSDLAGDAASDADRAQLAKNVAQIEADTQAKIDAVKDGCDWCRDGGTTTLATTELTNADFIHHLNLCDRHAAQATQAGWTQIDALPPQVAAQAGYHVDGDTLYVHPTDDQRAIAKSPTAQELVRIISQLEEDASTMTMNEPARIIARRTIKQLKVVRDSVARAYTIQQQTEANALIVMRRLAHDYLAVVKRGAGQPDDVDDSEVDGLIASIGAAVVAGRLNDRGRQVVA